MSLPKVIWTKETVFKKTPFILVFLVVIFVGFNIFLNLKIKNTKQELGRLESRSTNRPRIVATEYTKKIELAEKNCPSMKAGNPNAALKFKLFESETCPFCLAQNKVLDELLPEYGDLFYGEWYQVVDCQKESAQYKISGVPTFVFTAQGVENKPAYGFLDKQQLTDYICRVSGQC